MKLSALHCGGYVKSASCARTVLTMLVVVTVLSLVFGPAGEAASSGFPEQQETPLAAGSPLLVCKSGCGGTYYTTIGAAVSAASSGDEIHVAQGTYNEKVQVWNKSLVILGGYSTSNWNVRDPAVYVTTINGGGSGTVVGLGSSSGSYTGTFDGFTITGGNASGTGGGVGIAKYHATLSNNHIHHNQAALGAGVSVVSSTGVTLEGNVIEDNTASQAGAGLRIYQSTVSILDNDIVDNTATGDGGGLLIIAGTLTIDGNKINNNFSQSLGGAMRVINSSSGTISNNRIKANRAIAGSGGVRIEDSDYTVEGNEFMWNNTPGYGGGLSAVGAHVDAEDNDFMYNVADYGGAGMLYSTGATGLIYNNRLVDNEAGVDPGGGAIHFWRCSPQFIGNTVTDNTAAKAGGALSIEDSSPLVQDNVITDNHADDHGGAINIIVGSAPTLVGNTIARNTASVMGGAIWGYTSAPRIRRNEIVDNQAPTGGGIQLVGCVGLEITNNFIARNRATSEGGGILLTSNSRGDIINNTFVNNNLGAGGEAIDVRNSSRPRIANNVIVGHTYGVRVRDEAAPTVEYNDVWDSSVAHYAGVSGNPGHISCDPLFVNAAAGDYHLSVGSCVIDNGTQVGAPTIDFDGDGRPIDGDGDATALWDRGADEYQNPVWMTKEVSNAIVDPGDTISFTITYRNNSSTTLTGVVISDLLSSDLINAGYSSTGPTITLRGGTRYVWDVQNLAPGAEGTITITADVDPAIATPKGILNVADYSMNGYGPFQDEAVIVVSGLRTFVPMTAYNYQ
jgi:uncharacterized repeat protein (TIGR01451 family)